jgi:hypothetical protein
VKNIQIKVYLLRRHNSKGQIRKFLNISSAEMDGGPSMVVAVVHTYKAEGEHELGLFEGQEVVVTRCGSKLVPEICHVGQWFLICCATKLGVEAP